MRFSPIPGRMFARPALASRLLKRPGNHNRRILLDPLEDRCVPALMTYNNGPLIANVQVETIYYGANWGTTPALQTQANQLDAFFTAITDSTWMDIFSQYSVTSPSAITIGHGNLLVLATPIIRHSRYDHARWRSERR